MSDPKERLEHLGITIEDEMPETYSSEQRAKAIDNVAHGVEFMHSLFPGLADLSQTHGLVFRFQGTQNTDSGGEIKGQYHPDEVRPRITINNKGEQTLWHEFAHFLDHALTGRKELSSETRKSALFNFVTELMLDPARLEDEAKYNTLADVLGGSYHTMADYRASRHEIFARWFNSYMNYMYSKHLPGKSTSEPYDDKYNEKWTTEQYEQFGAKFRKILKSKKLTRSFGKYLDSLDKSNVQHPGSRGGHPHWTGTEWSYDTPPAGHRDHYSWHEPVSHDVHHHLEPEERAKGNGDNHFARHKQTGHRYLVKRFKGADFRAMTEDVGMALGRAWGLNTPGHTVHWIDGRDPHLIQRVAEGTVSLGEHIGLEDFQERQGRYATREEITEMYAHLNQRQVNEIFGVLVADYLTGNADAHSNNFLVTPEGDLIGIDRGQTGKYLGHPHFHLHAPHIDQETKTVTYTKGENAPKYSGGGMGQLYQYVMTNVLRGKYRPQMSYIRHLLENVEKVGDHYDDRIYQAAERHYEDNPYQETHIKPAAAKLQMFRDRRRTVRGDFKKMFAELGLDLDHDD